MSLGISAVSNQFLYASDTHNAQIDGFSINQTTGALTALGGISLLYWNSQFPRRSGRSPGKLRLGPGE
jgi:6-phosphogluconolactonase (cycloisomerase 2 family)